MIYREPLSKREIELAALIGAAMSNQQIAAALGISIHTVKNHIANIFGKLGASSRLEVALYAREQGLCAPTK
jgi:DNA-binding CsgD family transcriptional regulator